MSLRYLPEHAENALLALELARKEAAHLQYTHRTLFALPIDAAWVQQLASRDELAEKVEAFVSRFGRLQDHLGEKLIPRFAPMTTLTAVHHQGLPPDSQMSAYAAPSRPTGLPQEGPPA